MKTAVVLFNLGGPDSVDAVQPFLENLFNDPDIFKLPFQKRLAKFISRKRAPKVIEEYKLIGGKSPIGDWTELQRKRLEDLLRLKSVNADVFVAMRYWHPLTEETVKKVESGGYDKVILLPLYPHYSISTTGSSFNEWKRFYRGDTTKLVYVNSYFKDELYLKAVNEKIEEGLKKFPEKIKGEVNLVFSAHGTPKSYIKKGDPYLCEIMVTVEEIMKLRNNDLPHHLCFQSKVGPMKWLEPSTDSMIEKLASEGRKHLLIIPISFVSDHVETLFELDIEYRHIADEHKIENYIVMPGLNDSKIFADSLANQVINLVKETK
ncbi:MAG TPA: ferrochelatase [Ignavibacteriaceae bacterium]|jgi:ferrochelatase|nr:ferrochelatase [Ignavibacteriaceae bacterium]HOJ19313.1 ferrochelatase [Ignavibacteriaceae bacterium]HPO55416.1 ferrochelatase [Ignavibacteriaceae bacterium]